jgi:acetyl-CoA decarbonylase/synthase complex subunit delta
VANHEKDTQTLSAVAEAFQGKNLILGPVEEKNHKQIGAQALAYGHVIAANSPIDVNLAKQLNILLGNLGVKSDKILIDPTTGGLGYGMEYCYSVMERLRMAGLVQQDDNLQQPIINNMANEVWKCKEAKQSFEDVPTLGYSDDRGILMEATEAVALLLAGSDILLLRHPGTVKLVKQYINLLADGGEVQDEGLHEVKLVPADKLPKVEKKAAEPPKKEKAAAPAKPAAKAEAKPAPKPAAPKAEAKPAPKAEAKPAPKAEAKPEPKVDAAAEAEAKAKAEAEAKAKAEADAKAKADAEAAEKAKAKERDELIALRAKRAQEREEMEAKRAAEASGSREMKKAAEVVPPELVVVEKLLAALNRVHRR